MTMLTETRERFLLAIAGKLPVERVAEIHFFQPIKQGGVESGVAVVAVWPEGVDASPAEVEQSSDAVAQPVDESPGEADANVEGEVDVEAESTPAPEPRPTIYTARYRLTLKGPDRGKWETHVVAEADAPLITVDVVVRGVQRRAGDVDEPTRMEGDEVRAFLAARQAASAT